MIKKWQFLAAKLTKSANYASSALFRKYRKIMLVMTNYSKNYACTIYQRLRGWKKNHVFTKSPKPLSRPRLWSKMDGSWWSFCNNYVLCSRLFDNIVSDPNHKLKALLPPDYDNWRYNLRRQRHFNMPKLCTNRTINTFIYAMSKQTGL